MPKEARRALGLVTGDTFAFAIQGGEVRVIRTPVEGDETFASFSEWASEADRAGYADL
jgi:bifunctional DNA-binding transcriptional regulator/antitoxin component of YhaV-PrlF toxin-antitoxin module